MAASTIESCADDAHRTKGMLRTEHMIHFRKPEREKSVCFPRDRTSALTSSMMLKSMFSCADHEARMKDVRRCGSKE